MRDGCRGLRVEAGSPWQDSGGLGCTRAGSRGSGKGQVGEILRRLCAQGHGTDGLGEEHPR